MYLSPRKKNTILLATLARADILNFADMTTQRTLTQFDDHPSERTHNVHKRKWLREFLQSQSFNHKMSKMKI